MDRIHLHQPMLGPYKIVSMGYSFSGSVFLILEPYYAFFLSYESKSVQLEL